LKTEALIGEKLRTYLKNLFALKTEGGGSHLLSRRESAGGGGVEAIIISWKGGISGVPAPMQPRQNHSDLKKRTTRKKREKRRNLLKKTAAPLAKKEPRWE